MDHYTVVVPINEPFSTVIIAPSTGNQQIPHPTRPEAAAPAISELGALPPMEVFVDGHCPEMIYWLVVWSIPSAKHGNGQSQIYRWFSH